MCLLLCFVSSAKDLKVDWVTSAIFNFYCQGMEIINEIKLIQERLMALTRGNFLLISAFLFSLISHDAAAL